MMDNLLSNLSSNPSTLLALISAFIALLATIITPCVSVYIARRQIRATIVSANRQAWINALRDEISELFELLAWLFILRQRGDDEGNKDIAERRSRIRLLENRIRLRLNYDEPASKALLSLIWKLHNIAHQAGSDDNEELSETMQLAVLKTQEILKAEWERVKNGR